MRKGLPAFAGLKISKRDSQPDRFQDVHKVLMNSKSDAILTKPGTIGCGGNSGFQALNLAVQFGAAKIVLVGFDLRLDMGVHWHGRHERGLNNPSPQNMPRWIRVFDGAAPLLAQMGVRVINASMVSSLNGYEKMPLREALAC
jgi:hypothetical protein